MAELRGVFFDQDGVIVDTERDGHRVAFNRAFAELGLPFSWGEAEYGRLLAIGGGKERFRHFLLHSGQTAVPPGDVDNLVARVHRRKTDLFVELIESGELPLRPGVRRLMEEINAAGLTLGICTTSNERAARAIMSTHLAGITVDLLLAGDVVKRKKPDPEIYALACRRTGLDPTGCLAIEDSANGVAAARAAGLSVIVTVNGYTREEDHSGALLVITSLGDPGAGPGGECAEILRGAAGFAFDGVLRARDIVEVVR